MESDWQHQFKELKYRLLRLLQAEKLIDCQFVVGDTPSTRKTIPAHKLILSAASPVFEKMFYGTMAEKNGPIVINDIQFEVFQAMLKYIYSDGINIVTVEMACQLFYAAKKYMLPQLVEECFHYLSAHINPQNACLTYEFAEFFGEPYLMQKCLKIISERTLEVLQDTSFYNIKMSTMMLILDQDKLDIDSELDLFNALTKLAIIKRLIREVNSKSNTQQLIEKNSSKYAQLNDNEMLNEAVKKIRFLTLTPQQFAQVPARSNLLEKHEALDIFIILNSPINDNYPLPQGFSSSRNRRNVNLLNNVYINEPLVYGSGYPYARI